MKCCIVRILTVCLSVGYFSHLSSKSHQAAVLFLVQQYSKILLTKLSKPASAVLGGL